MKKEINSAKFNLICHIHVARSDLDNYLQVSKIFEDNMCFRRQDCEDLLSQILQTTPIEDHYDISEVLGREILDYESVFPSIYRESCFLSLYSFLEHKLNSFCIKAAKELGRTKKLEEDKQNNGVFRALKYTRDVLHFRLEGAQQAESFLRGANVLRNLLAHNGGRLKTNRDEAIRLVEHSENLCGAPGEKVCIGAGFLAEFVGAIRKIFDEIQNDIQRIT